MNSPATHSGQSLGDDLPDPSANTAEVDPDLLAFRAVQRGVAARSREDWPTMVLAYEAFLQVVEPQLAGGSPSVFEDVARAHSSLATAHLNLGDLAAAVASAQQAVTVARANPSRLGNGATRANPSGGTASGARRALAFHLTYLGSVHLHFDQAEDALVPLDEALAIYRQLESDLPGEVTDSLRLADSLRTKAARAGD